MEELAFIKEPGLPDHIMIRTGETIFLLPRVQAKLAIWHQVPDMIKDPDSKDAKNPDNQLVRLAIKAGVRPFLPKILTMLFGANVPRVPPRMDILKWLSELIVNVVVDRMSMHTWVIDVEKCTDCETPVYFLRGVSADALRKANT